MLLYLQVNFITTSLVYINIGEDEDMTWFFQFKANYTLWTIILTMKNGLK